MSVSLDRIHIWIPSLFGSKGGIQVYSAYLLDALQRFLPSAKYDVFLLHDKRCDQSNEYPPNVRFHFLGDLPLKVRNIVYAAQASYFAIVHKPNLIITTHLNLTPIAQRIKQIAGIPYWTSAHGTEAWGVTDVRRQASIQAANLILSVSSYTRDRIVKEQAISPQRIGLLPNTFDESRFTVDAKSTSLLRRYELRPDQPVIFTLGRLAKSEAYKGYDKVLLALPAIRKVIPNVHYVLAGEGDDRPRIESLIQRMQLQDCVTLTGYIPESELAAHYNLCDVFAMPSKGEGFGIVYLEAMACGKPVLGGNQDGAIDALCDGQLGALVSPDNIQEIASTIVEIIKGTYPNTLIYQPEALRQEVVQTFGFKRFQNTLSEYLKNSFSIAQT